MHTINLISEGIKSEWQPLPEETKKEYCAITGELTDCISRSYVISTDFTAQSGLSLPNSKFMSVDAFQALKYKWERMSSWYVDESGFYRMQRIDARDKILSANYGKIWSGYITTSYKKHGALRTIVNQNSAIWLFENFLVDCSDNKKVNDLYNELVDWLKIGIWRTSIETLDLQPGILKQVGYRQWIDFYEWAKDKYKSPLYQFMCYFLPSKEELKELLPTPIEKPKIEKVMPIIEYKKKKKEQLSLWSI